MNKKNIIIVFVVIISIIVILLLLLFVQKNNKTLDNTKNKILSKELISLIEKKWKVDIKEFGKNESQFLDYNIFFHEGLEIKKVNNEIFNIVFTERYEQKIINDIYTNSSFNKIIASLGEPDFGGVLLGIIGYKYDEIYIFFNESQVSVYENKKMNYDLESIAKESNGDLGKFSKNLMLKYTDFDWYEEILNSNSVDFFSLIYSHLGIKINYDKSGYKLFVYNNLYDKAIMERYFTNINIINKHKIYDTETNRLTSIHNTQYMIEQIQSTLKDEVAQDEGSDYIDNEIFYNESKNFIDLEINYRKEGIYNLALLSKNNKYPKSEIKEDIITHLWYDDNKLLYSIKNKGIYIYNAINGNTTTLIENSLNTFMINKIENDILYYDNEEIKIKM